MSNATGPTAEEVARYRVKADLINSILRRLSWVSGRTNRAIAARDLDYLSVGTLEILERQLRERPKQRHGD